MHANHIWGDKLYLGKNYMIRMINHLNDAAITMKISILYHNAPYSPMGINLSIRRVYLYHRLISNRTTGMDTHFLIMYQCILHKCSPIYHCSIYM